MSCQIKGIGSIKDLDKIKQALFKDDIAKLNSVLQNELPLSECYVSLSSVGDVLVLGWNSRLVTLVSKWDSQVLDDEKSKFHLLWDGFINKQPNEWITTIICLPLVALSKSVVGYGSDWTCIAVGFNTGYCRFYTETGALLLEEQLHNEPVLNIKCQSASAPRYTGDINIPEEIHIIFFSTICIIQGFPLFSTLRACRSHLARKQANCDDIPPARDVAFKKWGFKNQESTNDSEIIGNTFVSGFDHLSTASICGGYNALYRSSAPQHNLVIATGKRPYIGFHYALEGTAAPLLSDVAIAVVNKVATAFGNAVPWFLGNTRTQTSQETSKQAVNEPAEMMTCRYGLSDIMREGFCITTSPRKNLSVVTDAMGRVILLDNKKGIAIRMWKGYRNAQCGWIEVEEEKHRESNKNKNKNHFGTRISHKRVALFLVIYAPKKGVIDIWGIQQGSKITTFTASKNGRLLYTNYGLLGINDIAVLPKNKPQYYCVFIDPMGGLKEIIVPFHFALSSKNGERARDLHLLKKLKTFMREKEYNDERLINEVVSICTEVRTNEIKIQFIEMLINNKRTIPGALLAAVKCFKKQSIETGSDTDSVTKNLQVLVFQLERVINYYNYIRSRFDMPPEYNTVAENMIDAKNLSTVLMTTEREIHRILELHKTVTDLSHSNRVESKVKFKEDERSFLDFMTSFEFGTSQSIRLKRDVSLEKKIQIAQLMCQGWMYSYDDINVWKNAALESDIEPNILMQLALLYWIYKKKVVSLEMELKRFTRFLHAICLLADVKEICANCNEESTWWKNVRNVLFESTNSFNALTAALVCRAVAITLERDQEKLFYAKLQSENDNEKEHSNNDNNEKKKNEAEGKESCSAAEDDMINSISDWENVSNETCQFTLLIGNLEDITILDAVVSQPPTHDETTQFYSLPYEKVDISLSYIIARGKGSVTEIVSKWLSSSGINPERLVDKTDIEYDQMESIHSNDSDETAPNQLPLTDIPEQRCTELISAPIEVGDEAKVDESSQTKILDQITLLKRHFPYSLTSSVLLANLCWEFAMAWNKDIHNLVALEAAITVLKYIPSQNILNGVCCLLWTLYMKKRMETVTKLMIKSGKLPKERLCLQEIGLSNAHVTKFLEHCATFFDIFLHKDVYSSIKYTTIKSEQLWEGSKAGPKSFAELTAHHSEAWIDLVILHEILANILYMIAYFNLKVPKILNLFEPMAPHHFFDDITNRVLLTWHRDDKSDKQLIEFLCKVITASMETIHRETTDGKTVNSTEAVLWMSRCEKSSSMWFFHIDDIRIHQTCEMYINGFDRLGEEISGTVKNTEKLASKLLAIAGRRMMAHLSRSPDLLEKISRMSPALTKYLESLNAPELVLTNCANNDTIELIRKVARQLPETHSDYHISQLMLDATFIYED